MQRNCVVWISNIVFVDSISSIVYASNAKKVCDEFKDHFDRLNLMRIYYLWEEIAHLRQGTDSITSYYPKMKDLLNELDVIVPQPSCDCEESSDYMDHLKSQ